MPRDPEPKDLARDGRRDAIGWVLFLLVADLCTWLCTFSLARDEAPRAATVAIGYAALSLLAVVLLYVRSINGANPGAVLKGERHPWLQPVFLPYRAVAFTLTVIARVFHLRDPVVSEIAPGLFVGVRLFPHEHGRLRSLGVGSVVDLAAELPTNRVLARAPFRRYGLPTLDRTPPTIDEIASAAEWVASRRTEGDGVYIHCAFGRGRSAMVAAAVCIHLGWAHDAEGAVARVAEKRPVIRIRGAQLAALHAFAARHAARIEERTPHLLPSTATDP